MISSMSQTINKLNQNNSYKRATIANVYASTPKNVPVKRYSISLSGIDTASSSSGGRNLQLELQNLAKKRRKRTGKKGEDTKWKIKDSDSEKEAKQTQLIDETLNAKKRKKNLKSDKKTVKKKRILKDTESEWETESEKSVNDFSIDSQGSILTNDERIKLFEDPCTPEKTRDLPSMYEEILHTQESQIIDFSKKSHLISKKNDIILQDAFLPVNLLSSEVRNLDETDEDETIFQSNVPLRKPEKSPKQKPENFNFSIQSPTTTGNLRRDQSVKTYRGKISRPSPSPSSRTPIKLTNFMRKLPKVSKKTENIPIPPGMTCVSGYWNKTLRKWETYRKSSSQNELKNDKCKTKTGKRNTKKFTRKQKKDVYDTADEIDNEFETGGRDGKRMSFREFCRKQKKVKVISSSDA